MAGGKDNSGNPSSAVEIYNPANGSWSAANPMNVARMWYTATLLPNGKVLVAGGQGTAPNGLASAEIYDPSAGTWTLTGSMNAGRSWHTATLLTNGEVLVAGGYGASGWVATTEEYNPANGTWTTVGSLNNPRYSHTATLLTNGEVLVAGGNAEGYVSSSSEIFNPASQTWTSTSGAMTSARIWHTATLLPNGEVLVAGGVDGSYTSLASAELYNPVSGTWTQTTGSLATGREYHSATLLPGGQVLVAGGQSLSSFPTNAELYNPASGMWTPGGNLNNARSWHTATLLADGQVLLAGGVSNNVVTPTAELFNAGLGFCPSWQPQISTVSTLGAGLGLTITGLQFHGISGGSCGNMQDSSADYPIVELRSIESGQTVFLNCTNWSANSYNSTPVTVLPTGWTLATMFVNGIPSASAIIASGSAQPSITTQPVDTTVSSGSSPILSILLAGTPPFSYQWYFDGQPLAYATNATLTLTNFSLADAGSYYLAVTNFAGGVISQPFTVASVDIHMLASVYVNGPVGSNYLIQAASNLSSGWTTLTNIALPSQPYIYVDYSSITNKQKFYRALPE